MRCYTVKSYYTSSKAKIALKHDFFTKKHKKFKNLYLFLQNHCKLYFSLIVNPLTKPRQSGVIRPQSLPSKCRSPMYDSKYDSKMHDITIPLMGFNGFHHSGNSEFRKDFEGFIGRESIIDKLRSWLEDNDPDNDREDIEDRTKPYSRKYSGAYLITGFRGMGKSAFVHKTIREIKKKAQENKNNSCYYVPISINVGNDLLTSKELLYIICKLLASTFDEKTRWWHNNRSIWNLLITQVPLALISIGLILLSILKGNAINVSMDRIASVVSFDCSNSCLLFGVGVALLLLTCLMRYVYYYIWKRTDRTFFITAWQIKRVFKHLNERIDSEMTISSEHEVHPETKRLSNLGISNLSYIYKKRKENKYPIAQTSEIQDLLVNQLHLIKRLRYAKFRFIFIIDELDKISPEDDEEQIVPEYNSANVINGNSTYNSRQRAFVGLLANMKYFISSSEAKFIFITGYDMYEATLADISNREFNIHSIFNGYINVSSFLRKTGKSKGADSMIEEFFCHLLLEPSVGQEYKREDLGDYARYIKDRRKDVGIDNKRFDMLLNRRIIFLRHFLTYLFYMSNGSPKKLAMYMEKYVRSKKRVYEQIKAKAQKANIEQECQDIALGLDEFWDECEFFLYFDERNIKKIEFVNYLIYPMIKNLIAKSSIYNDKLLVSTSFMISNLYKFHKSGFSWRNLEYMPELLDINKTPELRDFIGGIMQFLNKTHIDEAAINLYKFKFPQRLSEEITYFSKTSEEISYLFNFSHDELLSIKKLYYQQLEHYSNTEQESPALASIHHMLGDIYMLEENYEQAIFEFNEALNAISRQEDDNSYNQKDSSNLLFRIRVSLKLGLAYEKRKTFDTAYITFENLVAQILSTAITARTTNLLEPAPHFGTSIAYHTNCSSFFSNIRLTYLGILAKAAVLEKMDLGGITNLDLANLHAEFDPIVKRFEKEIKSMVFTDFYTKLGVILFYKNGSYSCNNNEDFILLLRGMRERLRLDRTIKVDKCEEFLRKKMKGSRVNAPCMACHYFNASINNCMCDLGESRSSYYEKSRSIFFIEHLYNSELNQEIIKRGHVFLLTMVNVLVGMGNTLLGCIKGINDSNIDDFFLTLNSIFRISVAKPVLSEISRLNSLDMNHYAKSILYYLAAAKTYEILSDYKSAYNIYTQILDAVRVYYKAVNFTTDGAYKHNCIPAKTLDFCERITERAIECTYLHYGSINCAEIDTQKHEMGKKPIEFINLYALSNFPEIEVISEKYYHLCLFADSGDRFKDVLKLFINSRQMGRNKLIATLTQNVQNLFFKVLINEAILSRIIKGLYQLFEQCDHDMLKIMSSILEYYNSDPKDVEVLCKTIGWQFAKNHRDSDELKYALLDHLLKDSFYCLNKIIELLSPLFSTTLYNNTFIGEVFEKAYNWSDVLTCVREVFDYTEASDKTEFIKGFDARYSKAYGNNSQDQEQDIDEIHRMLEECSVKLSSPSSSFWNSYKTDDKTCVDNLYECIYSESNNYLTSSYLLGNAIDYFNRAIEMHSSGKSYKEMMPTLFFLEDDLQNDSNYMNLATERFLLNHNYVQEKLLKLRQYSFAKVTKSRLLRLDHYYINNF